VTRGGGTTPRLRPQRSDTGRFDVRDDQSGGGDLLTVAALLGDEGRLAGRARELMEIMMPAFDNKTGLSYARANPRIEECHNHPWVGHKAEILLEFGHLKLELNKHNRTSGNTRCANIGSLAYQTLRYRAKSTTVRCN